MIEMQSLHINGERHQHHAVQENVVLVLQVQAEARSAGGAITFADQILGAAPTAIASDVLADEFTH